MSMTSKLPFDRVLMDGIKDMVFVMRVKKDVFYYEFLNQAAMNGTGLAEDVIGKSIQDVNFGEKANFLISQYKKVVASLESVTYEDFYVSPLGEKFYSRTVLTPLIDKTEKCSHIVEVVKDITEHTKLVSKLSHSENRFRYITEHAHDLITVFNDKGEIICASPSHEKILGFSSDNYTGKLFFHNVHPEDINRLEKTISQSLDSKQPSLLQFKLKHKTKGWIWVELNGNPVFDGDGRFAHLIVITRDISLQKEYESKLKYFASHDPLTNLPNRRFFSRQLRKALKNCQEGLAIMLMDIDHFKSINDQMGHDIGDAVIAEFGRRIRNNLRDIDMVARLGGDEFVILLPSIESVDNATAVAARIQKAMEKPWCIKDYTFDLTTSIGIAMVPLQEATVSSVLKNADEALYEAKAAGRSTFKIRAL